MSRLSWVPLPVMEKAITQHLHREIALYLFLKNETNGYVRLKGTNKRYVKAFFGIADSTLYERLFRLKYMGWVGHSNAKSIYYIRGFNHLYDLERDFISKSAVEFAPEVLKEFDAYSFAAIVGYLVKHQVKQKKRRGKGQKMRCPNQTPVSSYQKVAIKALEKIIGLSNHTIIRLKKRALTLGYLKRKRTLSYVCDEESFHQNYYKSNPDHWGRLRRYKDKIVILGPDKFESQLRFKTKQY